MADGRLHLAGPLTIAGEKKGKGNKKRDHGTRVVGSLHF